MKIVFMTTIMCAFILMQSANSSAAFLPAEQLYKDGEKHLQNNENAKAYLVFRELVRDHPSSEYADDAHFLIAHYYLQQKDFFQAEREFLILINNYPNSPYVKDAREYFSRMRSRFLEDKVLDAMNNGDYKTAKVFLEEILTIDPSNRDAKGKLREVDNIIAKIDLQRKQLEMEKVRIEEGSEAIKKAREEVTKLREEAEKAMHKAEQMNEKTANEYDSLLSEAKTKEQDLESQIAKLENDLREWRERAKKYEAQQLAGKGSSSVPPLTDPSSLKILFEGVKKDPGPEMKEKSAEGILKDNSPTVFLISEKTNDGTNIMKAEFVLGLELLNKWPDRHYLKFRVDYVPLTNMETQKPTVIYYTPADMDEADSGNSVYKKKIIVAIDRSKVERYSVSAFFIRKD